MRLIDVDKLKKQITRMTIENHYSVKRANALRKLLDEQPAAFDADKIVEQLENYLFEKYCIEDVLEIEKIVKGGGIE